MKIVTWNVNSVRARLPRIVDWLARHEPDVMCLQETKVRDDLFPLEPLEDQGYNVVFTGEKSYNGVAILSKLPVEDVFKELPGDGVDAQKRVLGCVVGDIMLLNLYVPNGREVGHEQYYFKLAWLKRVADLLAARFDPDEKVVVTGDFNITFDDRDVHDPVAWREKIHCSTPERKALGLVMEFGLEDALRRHHEEGGIYTWWSHRSAAFKRNLGLRIDHFLLSPAALERSTEVSVDVEEREGQGPSDHAPLVLTLAD